MRGFLLLLPLISAFVTAEACPQGGHHDPHHSRTSTLSMSTSIKRSSTSAVTSVTSTSTLTSTTSTSSSTSSQPATASTAILSTSTTSSRASFNSSTSKIRGVNLGGLFVMEPWMVSTSWKAMGCGSYKDEWSCVEGLGAKVAQPAFENHWNSFYSKEDFTKMVGYGLNTVRIPVGYWAVDAQVEEREYFPSGSWAYIKQVIGWATEAGLWIILDLHGAPGAQVTGNPDTGHIVTAAGFYTEANYDRAVAVLTNFTTEIHTSDLFSNVIMLEVLNEPLQSGAPNSLVSEYYPDALAAVRAVEASLGVASSDRLILQYMSKSWGAGNPQADLPAGDTAVALDAHAYVQWATSNQTRAGYLEWTCTHGQTISSQSTLPLIVGEWSLSALSDISTFELDSPGAAAFYKQLAAAQITAYEKSSGWLFWSWKTEATDARWSYSAAVIAGYIPADLNDIDTTACHGYS